MKIITEPVIEIVARMAFDDEAAQRWLSRRGIDWHPTDILAQQKNLAEFNARLCSRFKKSDLTTDEFLAKLANIPHRSPFRHVKYTFAICGVSRSMVSQLLRHTVGVDVNQESMRYADCSDVAFVVPTVIRNNDDLYREWIKHCEQSLIAYRSLRDNLLASADSSLSAHKRHTIAQEEARSILPLCSETAISWTVNVDELHHILVTRLDPAAEDEIRRLCAVSLEKILTEFSVYFSDMKGYIATEREDR